MREEETRLLSRDDVKGQEEEEQRAVQEEWIEGTQEESKPEERGYFPVSRFSTASRIRRGSESIRLASALPSMTIET